MLGPMNLSRLYSNRPGEFAPIEFVSGLNVILAEIRFPENRKKDTHNLGKTTLGRLLDFGFLARRDAKFFLFKHDDLFRDFVFFFEFELADGSYVSVRRSVSEASKVAIKKHTGCHQDFSTLPIQNWDHPELPFERAKDLLDSLLDWRALKPWTYRKGLGYLLRSQDDFRDVFHLRRFAASHADWKPFLGRVLGFDDELIKRHYAKEKELSEKQEAEQTIVMELAGSVEDASKIEGLLLLKQQEVEKKQQLLDAFDFRAADTLQTQQLVEQVDEKIAQLNARRYSLMLNLKKITNSLHEGQILFDPEKAQVLFKEAGVFFGGQLKRDFNQLLAFDKAITEERYTYLQEERSEIQTELARINEELNILGKRRSQTLAFLSDSDAFEKYKKVSDELVTLRADITSLEHKRRFLHRLQMIRTEMRTLAEEKVNIQTQIEADVEAQNAGKLSMFSTIRLFFNEIVEEVIDRKALLSVSPNRQGHLEFRAEIMDEAGNATSADMGHTYKKLLCIAFDLAVLRAHLDEKFPKFVYHDGVFESLDDRKKENLLEVIRRYTKLGIQTVITLIDSDVPARSDSLQPVFGEREVVVLLHDESKEGRLFKMQTW